MLNRNYVQDKFSNKLYKLVIILFVAFVLAGVGKTVFAIEVPHVFATGTPVPSSGLNENFDGAFTELTRIAAKMYVYADDYNGGSLNDTTVNAAKADIGSTTPKVLVLKAGAWSLTGNVDTSTTKILVKMEQGAYFTGSGNFTGTVIAEPTQQIFGSTYTGTATLYNNQVFAQWWGAISYTTRALALAGTDSTIAIQKALDQAGKIVLIKGYYQTTDIVYIKYTKTHIVCDGTVVLVYNGAVQNVAGAAMLKIDKDTYSPSANYGDVTIYGRLELDGNDLALWGFWAKGLTYNSHIDDISITRTVGYFYTEDCWGSTYGHLMGWASYDGIPPGMDTAVWNTVHANAYGGQFTFSTANTVIIEKITCGRSGTSLAEQTAHSVLPTQNLIYISGNTAVLKDYSIESTNGYATKDNAVQNLIALNYGNSITVKRGYLENTHSYRFLFTGPYFTTALKIETPMVNAASFYRSPIYITKKLKLTLDDLTFFPKVEATGGYAYSALIYSADGALEVAVKNITMNEGDYVDVAGANYSELEAGYFGYTLSNTTSALDPATHLIKIESGLTTSASSDANGDFVLIEPGTIINTQRERRIFGVYAQTPNVAYIGKKIYAPHEVATWNVCVDNYGLVFIEKQSSLRVVASQKAVLATFVTDASGNLSAYTAYTNTTDGFWVNSTKKITYASAAPASGTAVVGDIVYNTAPASGQPIGWVCTVAGTPGTWIGFGVVL